jgi:hypothetical protein
MALTFSSLTHCSDDFVNFPKSPYSIPLTIVCWAKPTVTTGTRTLIYLGNKSSNRDFHWLYFNDSNLSFSSRSGLRNRTATTTTTFSANTWVFCAASVQSTKADKVLLNGAGKGTSSSLAITVTQEILTCGMFDGRTDSDSLEGDMCEVGIYSGEVSDATLLKMYNSRHSLFYFPNNLLAHYRMIFDDGYDSPKAPYAEVIAQDYVGNREMVGGTPPSKAAHIPNFRN